MCSPSVGWRLLAAGLCDALLNLLNIGKRALGNVPMRVTSECFAGRWWLIATEEGTWRRILARDNNNGTLCAFLATSSARQAYRNAFLERLQNERTLRNRALRADEELDELHSLYLELDQSSLVEEATE